MATPGTCAADVPLDLAPAAAASSTASFLFSSAIPANNLSAGVADELKCFSLIEPSVSTDIVFVSSRWSSWTILICGCNLLMPDLNRTTAEPSELSVAPLLPLGEWLGAPEPRSSGFVKTKLPLTKLPSAKEPLSFILKLPFAMLKLPLSLKLLSPTPLKLSRFESRLMAMILLTLRLNRFDEKFSSIFFCALVSLTLDLRAMSLVIQSCLSACSMVKRCSGSVFSIFLMMSCASKLTSFHDVLLKPHLPLLILFIRRVILGSSKGGVPLSRQYIMHPHAQTSTDWLYSLRMIISGAMYSGVPTGSS
mmetsp:Transcript_62406/g.171575  ORF Transcript_62406/g.171575 Transcript_62406/m.171575 type:complete len:307 (-) Transcript_62406:121-1041(-)